METSNLTVLIPTLNEEENIAILCERIHSIMPETKIMVIDDGSTDNTANIVKSMQYVDFFDRSKSRVHGLSISIKEGIYRCKTEVFMVIDGDLQHPPESLKDAIKCFKNDTDLVIGYRLRVENWPFSRKLISWGAQFMGNIVLLIRRKQRPKDIMSGFFGGNTKRIQLILNNANIADTGYKILFDILKVLPRDYKIEQFGYVFKNREHGSSKIGKKQIFAFLKSLLK